MNIGPGEPCHIPSTRSYRFANGPPVRPYDQVVEAHFQLNASLNTQVDTIRVTAYAITSLELKDLDIRKIKHQLPNRGVGHEFHAHQGRCQGPKPNEGGGTVFVVGLKVGGPLDPSKSSIGIVGDLRFNSNSHHIFLLFSVHFIF